MPLRDPVYASSLPQRRRLLLLHCTLQLLLLSGSAGGSSSSCRRLHINVNGQCQFAFPSCVIAPNFTADCASMASCDCYRECEEHWHYQYEPNGLPRPCFLGGKLGSLDEAAGRQWIYYDKIRKTSPGTLLARTDPHPDDGKPAPVPSPLTWKEVVDPRDWGQGCPNDCSSAGECEAGVCLCQDDRTGMDCSIRSSDHSLVNPSDQGFVFVYELPPGMNVWAPRPGDRGGTPIEIYEALLRSKHRTLDPNKAALFWLPTSSMQIFDGPVLLAMDYVRRTYPYYNRSNGADHVTVWSWDSGSCWVADEPMIKDTIKVSHFGLREKGEIMACNCPLCGPGGDVIIPDGMELKYKRKTAQRYSPNTTHDTSTRDTWVFFSGHSGGKPIREEMIHALRTQVAPKGMTVKILDNKDTDQAPVDLGAEMAKAKYCLDPPGMGFSTRGTLAIVMGCVPVYLGDFHKPFHNALGAPLDYPQFSITVPRHRINQLLDILQSHNYERLKANLDRVWHHFSWASLYGPMSNEPEEQDAFHVMLDVLCRQRLAKLSATSPLRLIPCHMMGAVQYKQLTIHKHHGHQPSAS